MIYKYKFPKTDPYDRFCGPGSHLFKILMLDLKSDITETTSQLEIRYAFRLSFAWQTLWFRIKENQIPRKHRLISTTHTHWSTHYDSQASPCAAAADHVAGTLNTSPIRGALQRSSTSFTHAFLASLTPAHISNARNTHMHSYLCQRLCVVLSQSCNALIYISRLL